MSTTPSMKPWLLFFAIGVWTLNRVMTTLAEIVKHDAYGALHYGSDAAMGGFAIWFMWMAWKDAVSR